MFSSEAGLNFAVLAYALLQREVFSLGGGPPFDSKSNKYERTETLLKNGKKCAIYSRA